MRHVERLVGGAAWHYFAGMARDNVDGHGIGAAVWREMASSAAASDSSHDMLQAMQPVKHLHVRQNFDGNDLSSPISKYKHAPV